MNTNRIANRLSFPTWIAGIVLIAASCVGKNDALVKAHENYNDAAKDPSVSRDAPVAMSEAKKTLDKADQFSKNRRNDEEVTHMAYIANRQVEIAVANANQQRYQNELSTTGQKRNAAVLEARTQEVDRANQRALVAVAKANESEAMAQEADARAQTNRSDLEKSNEREAKLQKELAELKAKETEVGTELSLRDMMFEIGKSDLTSGGVRDAGKIAAIAKQHPERDIVVEGHTDSMGTESYNQDLSERRAKTIAMILEEKGIPSDKITIKGYGQSFPIASNKTRSGRQLNRRVVVTILHEGKQSSDIEHKGKNL